MQITEYDCYLNIYDRNRQDTPHATVTHFHCPLGVR